MDADNVLRARAVRSHGSSVRALLEEPAEGELDTPVALPAADDLPVLPMPGDPYVAFARTSNKPQLTLRFLLADATIKGFSYADLHTIDLVASTSPGLGPMIVARFAGIGFIEARIEGRNLLTLYDKLGHHRIAWLRELPRERDFIEQRLPVINRVSFANVEG